MSFPLFDRTILFTIAGSRAYGVHMPSSDVDVKGVAVPLRPHFHGFTSRFEQTEDPALIAPLCHAFTREEREAAVSTKVEGTVYGIQKFFSLAAECNPNILDVLFCRDEEVRHITPLGRLLRRGRKLFLSAKAKHSFSGFAASQLKRIQGHRSWLLNPPKAPPTREQFGLPQTTLLPADHLAAANAAVRKKMESWMIDFGDMSATEVIRIEGQIEGHLSEIAAGAGHASIDDAKWTAAAKSVGLNENLIYVMQREREYEAAQRHWVQYSNWKKNRNPERAALEEKCGYDAKHAGHLYRLLRMGKEILTKGEVNVWRGAGGPGDAGEIQDIRSGCLSYDALLDVTVKMDDELEALYQAKAYVVPHKVDRVAVDELCVEIVEATLAGDLK